MDSLARDIADSLTAAVARFGDPSQRIYWPFLITSAVIALAVCVFRREGIRAKISKSLWLHPSAQMDYRLFLVNAALKGLIWGSVVVSALSVVYATVGALDSTFGTMGNLGWASWQISLLYTVVLFVGLDASRFALHLLMHRIPALWSFHQVHHSAEVLTPVTVYRVHPLESFLYGMRGAICTGIITGAFWYLFHGAASQAELLGINAIGLALNALGANLRHSHIWLSYGRLESILMSPAQHQMHHGTQADTSLANYGAFLSLWDKLAGTFVSSARAEQPGRFGLAPDECNHRPDSVLSAYFGPIEATIAAVGTRLAPATPRPATALLAISAMQCTSQPAGSGLPDASTDDFDRAALVQNLANAVIVPTYEAAIASSAELTSAIESYCEGLGTGDETLLRDQARTAWASAMNAWQRAELSIIGPASPDSLALRDFIYSWPVTSACAVDQAVMDSFDNDGFDISGQLLNRRGIDALEYLLYNQAEDSACAPQIRPAGWDALPTDEKWRARCEFAQEAAADLEGQQSELLAAWTKEGGYLSSLESAGTNSSEFASPHEAVNAIFAGLFYLDLQTKDAKLGAPLGVTENNCDALGAPCVASLESQYSHTSKESITANLEAFELLFQGADGLGFDDFLIARDASDTADAMRAAITTARAALTAIDVSLADALANDAASTQAAFEAIGGVTDILKNEVPQLLLLDIPEAAGGDAD